MVGYGGDFLSKVTFLDGVVDFATKSFEMGVGDKFLDYLFVGERVVFNKSGMGEESFGMLAEDGKGWKVRVVVTLVDCF